MQAISCTLCFLKSGYVKFLSNIVKLLYTIYIHVPLFRMTLCNHINQASTHTTSQEHMKTVIQ